MIAWQGVAPPDPAQPWPWLAALMAAGIGVLFWQLMGSRDREVAAHKETVARCQGREDKLIEADIAKNQALRDLTNQGVRSVELTEKVISGSAEMRTVLDSLAKQVTESSTRIQTIESTLKDRPPASSRRGTSQ